MYFLILLMSLEICILVYALMDLILLEYLVKIICYVMWYWLLITYHLISERNELLFLTILTTGSNHPKLILDVFHNLSYMSLISLSKDKFPLYHQWSKLYIKSYVLLWNIFDFFAYAMLSKWNIYFHVVFSYCMCDR